MKKLSKKEAAAALGISVRSLERKMQHGQIKSTTDETQGQFGQKFFTYEDLGLHQLKEQTSGPAVRLLPQYEEPAAVPDIAKQEAFIPRELSEIERRELADAEYAEQYKSGNATDSYGNTVTGNRNWPSGKVTAIGPMEPAPPKQRVACDSHMPLAGWHDKFTPRVEKPWDDSAMERLHPGHLARKEKMCQDAGVRQPSQQQAKQVIDIAAIRASFRQGYSR